MDEAGNKRNEKVIMLRAAFGVDSALAVSYTHPPKIAKLPKIAACATGRLKLVAVKYQQSQFLYCLN